ncbi:kinase-like domain-containing protein [Mycena galericulata]|nr:kinase-like domain-containing protein [Mycena galericulata]
MASNPATKACVRSLPDIAATTRGNGHRHIPRINPHFLAHSLRPRGTSHSHHMKEQRLLTVRFLPTASIFGDEQWYAADTIDARPFLALELKDPRECWEATLFLIASEEVRAPEGYSRVELSSAPSTLGSDCLRSLVPLPSDRKFFLHTRPIQAFTGNVTLPPVHLLHEADLDEFARRVAAEVKPTEPGDRPPPSPLIAFEVLPPNDVPDAPPSIYDELLAYERLKADFSWKGVAATVEYVLACRQIDAPAVVARLPQSAADFDTVAEVLALAEMKIPIDGEPPAERKVAENSSAEVMSDSSLPAMKWALNTRPVLFDSIKVILFDPRDTILDCVDALYGVLLEVAAGAHPWGMLSAFVEGACFRSNGLRDGGPSQIIHETLEELATRAETTLDISAAVRRVLSPSLHSDALPALERLRDAGFHLCQLPDVYVSAEAVDLEVVPLGSPMPLWGQTTELARAFAWAKERFGLPLLQPSEMLVVTGSSYRVVETANTAFSRPNGFPTAFVARRMSLAPTVWLPNAAPTLIIGGLDELEGAVGHPPVCIPWVLPDDAPYSFRIWGHYQCMSLLGKGGFGQVWAARHVISGDEVAVKLEVLDESRPPTLPYEAQIYRDHGSKPAEPGLNVLILDRLGPTLEDLRRVCRGKLSLRTTCALGRQMLAAIAYVHSRGIILRDVTPANFAMGIGNRCNVVHLFDFGLAKLYVDPKTQKHIPLREGLSFVGTARYASHNAHLGRELSRRDDIESLGICLLYLHKGTLPWQGLRVPTPEEKVRLMAEMNAEGRFVAELSAPFLEWFNYARGLAFEESPDYERLLRLLDERAHPGSRHAFDWSSSEGSGEGTLVPGEWTWASL